MTDIPRIVYDRLPVPPASDVVFAASHPDLELLAAFMDQALTPHGRENILRHLALCQDCREIVVLATTPDEIVDAELPEQEQPEQAPARGRVRQEDQKVPVPLATTRNPWLSWARPNLGWAALAAGVAVAASMLVLHPLQQKQAMLPASNQTAATNLPSAADSQPSAQPQQPSQAGNRQSSRNGSLSKGFSPKKEAKSSFSMRQRRDTDTPPLVADNQYPRDEALMARSTASPIKKAKPALQDSESQAASSSAARAVKWKISEGVLERSFDNGRSWQIGLRAEHPLLCYASHGQDIWVGGQAGMLMHSSDDGHTLAQVRTSQVPTSDDGSPSADVTGIDLRDADVANGSNVSTEILISTAAGEVWSSTDSGNTWNKQ